LTQAPGEARTALQTDARALVAAAVALHTGATAEAEATQWEGSRLLLALAAADVHAEAVVVGGGVRPLLRMLSVHPTAAVRGEAVAAMSTLAAHAFSHAAIRDAGGVGCIVSSLLVGEVDERRHAAVVLAALAMAPDNHRELQEADGVHALLDVLKSGGVAEAAPAGDALLAFAAPAHNKRLLRDMGALSTLVWLLLSGTGVVKAKVRASLGR